MENENNLLGKFKVTACLVGLTLTLTNLTSYFKAREYLYMNGREKFVKLTKDVDEASTPKCLFLAKLLYGSGEKIALWRYDGQYKNKIPQE